MPDNRTWLWILIAALVALGIGFGTAWLVQAQKIDAAEKALATSKGKAALLEQDLGDANKALDAAIAERDKLRLAAAGASSTDTSTGAPGSGTSTPAPKPGVTGKRFGYIKKFETKNGTVYVTYDQAEFLTGKAAADAATAHGDESPPPNDYYIVNDNKLLRTVPLASSVKVTLTTEPDNVNPDGYPSTLAKLRGAFNGTVPGLKNAMSSPYWFTLKNGVVTAIAEQYLP